MTLFGSFAFMSPWLLLGLIALPILWWLLRAVPPAARLVEFPGVRILLGLDDIEKTPDRTPWWLLVLRLLAIAAVIIGFARPILNPDLREQGDGPLMLVMDGGWASAPDWRTRQIWAEDVLNTAAREGRPVAFVPLTNIPSQITFADANTALERVAVLEPAPHMPNRARLIDLLPDEDFDTLWLHDGIDRGQSNALAQALSARGSVRMVSTDRGVAGLRDVTLIDGVLEVEAVRSVDGPEAITVHAIGPDPAGIERVLSRTEGTFENDVTETSLTLDIPLELRNRITRFELSRDLSAGGVQLGDDNLRRRKIGLLQAGSDDEGQQLIRPMHYLRKALVPSSELIEAPLTDILLTSPDMIILADVGNLSPIEEGALIEWVEDGGLLLRFAGPRLAQATSDRLEPDPLLPVRLRAGGRSIGGAMSWGAPKRLRPFTEGSPFFGLVAPGEVDVSTQVMAQPDPDLPNRVMAALEDGTPLVTGDAFGEGRIILFHVTANAEWSSLPLSGLFVQMLERLALLSGSAISDATELEGRQWTAQLVLDGYGRLTEPPTIPGVDGEVLAEQLRDASTPPGLYASGEKVAAINLLAPGAELTPISPPPGIAWDRLGISNERPLQAEFLLFGLILLGLDVLATLWVSGRLRNVGAASAMLAGLALMPQQADAQETDIDALLYAANNTVLAYVETGNPQIDQTSHAGLWGLSRVLNIRTAIEPTEPVSINLEIDSLAAFPFLYWPISETQTTPSDAAYAKLNAFLRSGGMILFDTRDAHLAGGGFGTPNGRVLQRIAAKLDVPPLAPLPPDHVLTRTFYLLQSFPGRWNVQSLWVEAAPEVEAVEGMPFRNLNDGVTPVVIGGNDWAAAWAIDENGNYLFPVGRGSSGDRQREMAFRFGVNLVMHVMTGNYKSDQVHVPALLERLGN